MKIKLASDDLIARMEAKPERDWSRHVRNFPLIHNDGSDEYFLVGGGKNKKDLVYMSTNKDKRGKFYLGKVSPSGHISITDNKQRLSKTSMRYNNTDDVTAVCFEKILGRDYRKLHARAMEILRLEDIRKGYGDYVKDDWYIQVLHKINEKKDNFYEYMLQSC